jgi:hypothetical protein
MGDWLGPIIAAFLSLLPATREHPVQVEPQPPPITAPADSRCAEWFSVALDAGFTEEQWPTVDRLMWCESNCQPKAYNRSGASGLMQIMPMHHHGRDPFDPATNLVMAHEVYERQGWRAWSCY